MTAAGISGTSSCGAAAESLPRRIGGLDTLRLLLASWVVFGHLGDPIRLPDPSSLPLGLGLITAVYANTFNGPAAVICFFVISGFCIHFPFRDGRPLELLPYYARRHVRIWVPILAAIVLAYPLQVRLFLLHDSILWSLICEEIYYLLYPALAVLARRWSWDALLIPSFAAALAVAATNPTVGDYPSFGIGMNWILGLPCWLLGCRLASRIDPLWFRWGAISHAQIWTWRAGIVGAGAALSLLRFHGSIGYPWSLTVASPLAAMWICREILYRRRHAPVPMLESLGLITYSLYLTHLHGAALFRMFITADTGTLLGRFGILASAFLAAGIFYFLFERPSHQAARRLARWITDRRTVLASETGFGSPRLGPSSGAAAGSVDLRRRSPARVTNRCDS